MELVAKAAALSRSLVMATASRTQC
jgi:hypothetical protein